MHWYPGRCPGLGTSCPFRALAARVAGGPARAESPTSSEPRATPWVNVRTTPAPCKGKSNKQQVRPYFCPYRAKGFIPWYPGRCPGLGTGCPFRALAARVAGGPARAESPTSSEPRATPWVNVRTTPAPCKGKSNKQQVRPYFCPYRAKGFIPWYPGRCPGLGTGCPFRALAAQFVIISPARPRNSLIRLIRCYAV